ncbi:hypothetical protein [Pseudomonas sp. CNPSo 3701]|uniref:hypothetical protein n=1 Tax=Pseudomonas sp. CNPSo 3701 TaxID=3027943 RepID=UPI002363BC8E|nr:hypothetical protein [Pseudomonas sp. CNPSo 3701]MDD1510153.1 hypothetical protein [Pseudomonas sp. CNPSo 3701]
MQKMASELGANTEFQIALAELMRDGATGGLGRAGGIKAPAITGTGGVKGTSPQGTSAKIDPNHLDLITSHPNAHSLARHGGSVTDEQLLYRATSGIAPDGHVKAPNNKTVVPPMSSAFHSDQLLVRADQAVRNGGALQAAIAKNPGATIVTVKPADVGDLGISLGRGFERVGGSKLNPELMGAPRKVNDLRSVQATYELNPVTKKWETITIFPSR